MNFYKVVQILLGVGLVITLALGVVMNLNRTDSTTPVNQAAPAGNQPAAKFNF